MSRSSIKGPFIARSLLKKLELATLKNTLDFKKLKKLNFPF